MLGKQSGLVSLVGAVVLLGATPARAGGWQEMHETSDDVRLEIGANGIASVQHHLRYRVVAGHFKTIDLVGIDPRAEILPEATVTAEKGGAELLARVEPVAKTPGTLRLLIDEGKGLGRGTYVVDVTYRLDLVTTKMLSRDGAMWKVSWTAPPAPEGHDGARVIFDVPSAPTEPRLAGATESTTTLPTLRRGPARDELELVRAHVPRGEAVIWTARVDPKAFPQVTSPELRPPPAPEAPPPSIVASNLARIAVAATLAGLAGALAFVLQRKQRAVRLAAEARGAIATPLIAVPWGLGPFLYGVLVALGFAALVWQSPIAGAGLLLGAIVLAAHRAPRLVTRPRGPGAWQTVPDRLLLQEPPAPLPTDALDLGARRGRVVFVLVGAFVAAATVLLRNRIPQVTIALPLASLALVPLFLTGTRAQLAPTPREVAARLLRPARDGLARAIDLSHVEVGTIGRATSPTQEDAIDELRLRCLPRDRTPGLRSIELAVAASPTGGALPEVLLRFDDASAAADRVRALGKSAAIFRGRNAEERVARLVPEGGSANAAAAMVAELLLALEGRRATDRGAETPAPRRTWTGRERRLRIPSPGSVAPA